MLFIKAVTIALIASALSCASALYYKDVTADNFDELIDPSKASILLEFYAPWCGHVRSIPLTHLLYSVLLSSLY